MEKPQYYKIYAGGQLKLRVAHFEVTDGDVTACSPAIAFMLGWPMSKVRLKAEAYGFRISNLPKGTRNTSFVTTPLTVEQRKALKQASV